MGFKGEKTLRRKNDSGREKLSDKETDRATMAQSKEAPWQPQKNQVEQNDLLQEVTVKMETVDVQKARLQDLKT